MKNAQEITTSLRQFSGTLEYHRWSALFRQVLTDGAKYLADSAECYWLMDIIASAQFIQNVSREDFQSWTIKVRNNSAIVTCDDGNGNVVYTQEIEYTDFPLPECKLFFTDNVILLPSEY